MKTLIEPLLRMLSQFELWVPAAVGGFVDYINQVQRGSRQWEYFGFIVHLVSAIFFGWMTGMLAGGLEYDTQVVAAAGGIGGFLGVRIADLIVTMVKKFK